VNQEARRAGRDDADVMFERGDGPTSTNEAGAVMDEIVSVPNASCSARQDYETFAGSWERGTIRATARTDLDGLEHEAQVRRIDTLQTAVANTTSSRVEVAAAAAS